MIYYLTLILGLFSLLLVSAEANDPDQGNSAAKWGYEPKYCYKNVCEDVEKCDDVECNCVELDYVCGCKKEEEYYFKKSGYGGGYGSGIAFYKKKVCIDYKLCHYKKCKTCHKCYTETKCEKVKVPCYGKY